MADQIIVDRVSVASAATDDGFKRIDAISMDDVSMTSSATDDGARRAANVSFEPRFFVDFEGDAEEFMAPVKCSSRLSYTAVDISRFVLN